MKNWKTSAESILTTGPVVPVIVVKKLEHAVPMAKALVAGGVRVLEVTLRTECAVDAIRAIAKEVPEAIVGAGTVLNPQQLAEVTEAGAQFAISPGLTEPLLKAATEGTIPLIPGISTVSELMLGMDYGLKEFKFFPAEANGGVKALQAIAGPFSQVRFCPTGGISPANYRDYLALKSVLCIGGSWLVPADALEAGEVGYISASIKNVRETKVGDTITDANAPADEPLPGYKQANPMVFCGIYPADGADYENLRDALDKLVLNDASLSYEPETSMALGFGFRCGFLGLLHMEIIQERLEREFDLDLVTTAPSVIYKVVKTNGDEVMIDNPTNLPPVTEIAYMEEPMVRATIMSPSEYVGTIMELCQDKRGVFEDMKYIEEGRVNIFYELPLNEIIYDFFDQLKSRSRGYASFDYELKEYAKSDLVKLDFLLNGDMCDALSTIVHKDKAYAKGRAVAEKLQEVIPRQQFEIPIQAAIGGKIIARETVRAVRKDVLAKCYGGDITRKKKLLEKQKEGKKRMRQIGTVSLPSEAFMSVLKIN